MAFSAALSAAIASTPAAAVVDPAADAPSPAPATPPMPVEVVSIRLDPSMRLFVTVGNRAGAPVAGWVFAVEVDGAPVAGYDDLLFFQPLAPGADSELELLRPSVPAGASTIRVSIVEAMAAERVADSEPSDPESSDPELASSWRLLDVLPGAPPGRIQPIE